MANADIDQMLNDRGIVDLSNGNGDIPPTGAGLSTNVQPASTGTAQRQFGRQTAQESNALHSEVKDYLYNNSSYTTDSNQAHFDRAISWVQSHASETDQEGLLSEICKK